MDESIGTSDAFLFDNTNAGPHPGGFGVTLFVIWMMTKLMRDHLLSWTTPKNNVEKTYDVSKRKKQNSAMPDGKK